MARSFTDKYKSSSNFLTFAMRHQNLVVLMRTAERADRFCIYDEQFTFDPNHVVPLGFGPPQYSCEEILRMFGSGELRALK